MNDLEEQLKVKRDLGLIPTNENDREENKRLFENKHKSIFNCRRKIRKGAKLLSPQKNENYEMESIV